MPETIFGRPSGPWWTVRTEEQASLLARPDSRRFLEPFIGRERTAGEAARELGVSIERLLYRVRQFRAAGLLLETGQRRRAGRPERVYRAVADAFVVPFALTPFADLEAQIARQAAPLHQLELRAGARAGRERGLTNRLIYRDTSGELHSETALPEGTTWQAIHPEPGGDYAGIYHLDDATAREIGELWEALRDRLQQARRDHGEGRPYLIRTAMVPLRPEDLAGLPPLSSPAGRPDRE
ncbi:helix-turn-helix transcriptional regulator [Deinococcus sp. KSM4-11]|uniref:ArsR/SmtB family transcription factor n=1 Tax=Deinococcus sp. KSM4-11 TaxID=2568654 RepID=UPI0010A3495E|nr:helix-turn-helix domain-containing protein [Deinococcus sp. KSM4-11]THF86683.1 helix-turn-helix transcriptional regulator [Deinococcus sp. KSM4-11]